MKKLSILLIALTTLFVSCSKDNPTPEVDQEELGTATLTFTPVEKVTVNNITSYVPIQSEEVETIKFSGTPLLPPVGAHLHLHVGLTYKLDLVTTDFAGRESQQSFLNNADNHQVFLLGTNDNIKFEYGDAKNVGITSYVSVLKEGDSNNWRFILRHLNNGVKSKISSSDWNNNNFTQFTGANDLDLKFEVHLVREGEGH